ncbi:MAG: YqeG family HAD IIIA-type phosphatase [Syntrophomonadaceae bacterium]|jgi:HAD superfamily phosphatase (TIGR01668 family)|nr:YqeG family HAD IIIA-type phosphatase [Syntrophomonadaceae bacterium]
MIELLYPRIYVASLADIPLEALRRERIRAYILDLDNTLTMWNSNELAPGAREWLEDLRAMGGKACLLSNNHQRRVAAVAEALDIPSVHKAGKPRRRAFERALEQLSTPHQETAVVGDQVFTDILGGNRMGMLTILVKPIHPREYFGTRLVRKVERLVVKRLPQGPTAASR